MQDVADVVNAQSYLSGLPEASPSSALHASFIDHSGIRRNGAVDGLEPSKLSVAMTKAFLNEGGIRVHSDVLCQDLLITMAGKKFSGPELAPAVE
jgi:hypothetical protein